MATGALLGAAALGLAACSSGGLSKAPTTTTPVATTAPPVSKTTTTAPSEVSANLYFVRGTTLGVAARSVNASSDPRYTAMQALLGGPNPSEVNAGLGTAIPAGTTMRGLEIRGGVATINLSPQFLTPGPLDSQSARLAQIVYTLTGYPNVNRVAIQVSKLPLTNYAGLDLSSPVDRSQITAALPPVLLEAPAVGSSVHGSLTVSGLTSVNGTYEIELSDPTGRLVASTTNTAVPDATFQMTLPLGTFTAGLGTVRVFASPRDSSVPAQLTSFTVPLVP